MPRFVCAVFLSRRKPHAASATQALDFTYYLLESTYYLKSKGRKARCNRRSWLCLVAARSKQERSKTQIRRKQEANKTQARSKQQASKRKQEASKSEQDVGKKQARSKPEESQEASQEANEEQAAKSPKYLDNGSHIGPK